MNIGVFFGSGSPEHDVSIITGQLVINQLKKLGHKVTPVYITKQGKWMFGEELGSIKLFSDPNSKIEEKKKFFEYYLDLETSIGKMVFRKKGFINKAVTIDLAFPALHGSYGEDGTIQGLFEMFGLPYVGCDVAASAVAMEKVLTKQVLESNQIPTPNYIYFYKSDWKKNPGLILEQIKKLKWPVFVKPVHLGSSIGIAKVKESQKELIDQIEVALHYDNKVLVEESIENLMDVTCCIIGNDELTVSYLQESVFNSDLFDFEEKYLKDGGAQLGEAQNGFVIPARLSEAITKSIQETAKKVYRALGCSGIARVDFLLEKNTNQFYVSEVNPLPGTLYHHLWKASGIELGDLVNRLIDLAKEKYEQKRSVNFTFNSNILSQLNSTKLNSKKLRE